MRRALVVLLLLLMVRSDAQEPLNYCAEGGFLGGPSTRFGQDVHDHNWGRAQIACSRLKCTECGAGVEAEDGARVRNYHCDCTKWGSRFLESVTEYRTEGPADIPVEMPPWRCTGHPPRDWAGALSEEQLEQLRSAATPLDLAKEWDRVYHYWASTPGQSALLEELAGGPAESLLVFWGWNPESAQTVDLLSVAESFDDPTQARLLARTLHTFRQEPSVRRVMREAAKRPGFATPFIPFLDKTWLRKNALSLMQSDPTCGQVLCSRAARADYGWDKDALRALPLEVLRAGAATMPRTQLSSELDVYWQRDYLWLSTHMVELCSEASDFYFYFKPHLQKNGWAPEPRILALWHNQALDTEHAYNALPALIKYDTEWVVTNLGRIVDESQTRGVWLVDELKRAGVDIRPLLPILRDRDPEDLESHLPLWFPEGVPEF